MINASAMDVMVTVPEGAALSEVEVKTRLGDVFVSGLEVEKALEVQTGLGDVECYEVHTGNEVSLESGMGDVTLGVTEPYSGVEFDLKTGVGTIEAQMDCYERDWEYEVKTGVGEVIVNGVGKGSKAERKGGSYKLEAESGVGEINLYFQDDRW